MRQASQLQQTQHTTTNETGTTNTTTETAPTNASTNETGIAIPTNETGIAIPQPQQMRQAQLYSARVQVTNLAKGEYGLSITGNEPTTVAISLNAPVFIPPTQNGSPTQKPLPSDSAQPDGDHLPLRTRSWMALAFVALLLFGLLYFSWRNRRR